MSFKLLICHVWHRKSPSLAVQRDPISSSRVNLMNSSRSGGRSVGVKTPLMPFLMLHMFSCCPILMLEQIIWGMVVSNNPSWHLLRRSMMSNRAPGHEFKGQRRPVQNQLIHFRLTMIKPRHPNTWPARPIAVPSESLGALPRPFRSR